MDKAVKKNKNISPLRYPGGKTRACKKLDDVLTEHFDTAKFDGLISPFFGGGSFEFFLQSKYGYSIEANDKFTPLYNFWLHCKLRNEELCNELISKMKVNKEKFQQYREEILNVEPFQQAILYFIINRCSFSGSTMSGGFSVESSLKRFTKSSIERVRKLDLSKFEIDNKDFKQFLEDKSAENKLIFLDPPYYLDKKSKLYGKNGDLHEAFDHDGLFTTVSKLRNWIMTYNDCEYIRNLYKDFTITETSWSYGMNKSKASSEIVIICK